MFPFPYQRRRVDVSRDCLLGYAMVVRHAPLQIDWTGTAQQIIQRAAEGGLILKEFANDLPTQIELRELHCHLTLPRSVDSGKDGFEAKFLEALRVGDSRRIDSLAEQVASDDLAANSASAHLWFDMAAASGSVPLIRKLGAIGANHEPVIYGMTPLHWAAAYGHADAVIALIEIGIPPAVFNHCMWSAADLAAANKRTPVTKALAKLGYDPLPGLVTGMFLRMGIVPAK